MKKNAFIFVLTTLLIIGSNVSLSAQNNINLRANYIIKELKLNKAEANSFRPVCLAFLNEMHVAKSGYSNLKDKYKNAIKKGMITNGQATALMNAHLTSDQKELSVRQKYFPIFLKRLNAKQVYYAFDYANDSMKKVKGLKGKKDKSDSDEDE